MDFSITQKELQDQSQEAQFYHQKQLNADDQWSIVGAH